MDLRPSKILDHLLNALGGRIAIVDSGFGDGTSPVYELLVGSERVGFEVVFVPTDEPYPWEILRKINQNRARSRKIPLCIA